MSSEGEQTSASGSESSSSDNEHYTHKQEGNRGTHVSSRSAFDAYFAQTSRSQRTSSNVFSELVPQLSVDEFAKYLKQFNDEQDNSSQAAIERLEHGHDMAMPQYLLEMSAGFNLMFYGLGSKRKTLNRFALKCAKRGHVVVANGFSPSFNLNALVLGIERIFDLHQGSTFGSGIDGRIQRIITHFSPTRKRKHLFVIFHNLDIFLQRHHKATPHLTQLLACSSIHVAASADRVQSSTYIQISDLIAAQRASSSSDRNSHYWLWHDLTTMQRYDFELSHSDRTSYIVFSSKDESSTSGAVGSHRTDAVNERAAYHVLASVTEKAKKLFKLLAQKQLDNMHQSTSQASARTEERSSSAISYDVLFTMARDNFLASSDTALRALLSEFRDHNIVVGASSNAADGGEVIWIPLSVDALGRICNSQQLDNGTIRKQ